MHLTDTLEIGGAERMAVSLANSLPRTRFEPHVCTTRRTGPLSDTIASDVGVFSLNRRRTLDVRALWSLVAYIRQHNIQILHAHGSAVFVSAAASMFRPYPTVIWHIHYGRHATGDNSGWRYRLIKSRVSRSIAVSEPLAAWAKKVVGMPAEKVAYIPNFSLLPKSNGGTLGLPGKRGSRIVCVANFLPEKDHINLLRAMEIVVKVRPDACLLLVGGGNNSGCETGVRAHIKTAGLGMNVNLLGQRRDVHEILRAVDIGVLSSEAEGLPLALIEYGEAGLPVVVTEVGQCADVVDHGLAGVVVPAKSPADLARGILSLLMAPQRSKHLGDKLRLRVQQDFSKQRIVERVYEMYGV
jgi:glycosyltransferase involved in cell wall biosynthesis